VIRGLCCNHQAQLAVTLLRMGRHADAAGAARELPRLTPNDPDVLLRAARLIAGCVPVAERDSSSPFALGFVLARAYGGEAIALARAAVAQSLADAPARLSDPDFASLRNRDEFRSLLDEVTICKE
jgi:hypothetical protein